MSSYIERKVNEICGRWLDGFTKDNVDVSLLQAKITLSDLHFKTDELCLLSPTFAPSLFYVGKLSIDIPLAWQFSRPVKIVVSDLLGVVRVCDHETLTAEDARKCISANVHVKAILSKLAAELGGELGGGKAQEGRPAERIYMQTVHNIHKIMRKLEVTMTNAHVRVEEPVRKALSDEPKIEASTEAGVAAPAIAFGVCLRSVSLGLDERADAEAGGGSGGERWFGKKFGEMDAALLENFSRYDAGDIALEGFRAEPESGDPSVIEIDGDQRHAASMDTSEEQATSNESGSSSTLMITKFGGVRSASVYFCRDEECYSANDREETLRRLREGLKNPPTTLPPVLRRCRAGIGLKVVLSAREWGKIESVDVRLLAGDINVQIGDDHVGYLLRWSSLLIGHKRTLALVALRPRRDAVPPSRNSGRGACSDSSRFYRALWQHAVEAVLRDLRSSIRQRGEKAREELRSTHAARDERIDRPWTSEESEYRATRGLLWRTWFAEWVGAARYLSLRQMIQSRLVVESFADKSGGTHRRLCEDLEVQRKLPARQVAGKGRRATSGTITGESGGSPRTGARELAKYLMPWQLPQEDVEKAWTLITRKTLRWELRATRDIKLAIDEERKDQSGLDADPAVLQALWSIQLQLDAQLPNRICAFARRMAFVWIGWRTRIDRLWQARAEKQRRLGLGLGEPPTPPRLAPHGSTSCTESEAGFFTNSSDSAPPRGSAMEAVAGGAEDGGDGADHVGTLLVRMGQLDGVESVGLLSLAPKAVATLMLEESSATLEEMNLETVSTEVAKYDHKNERCFWNQSFRLQVELNEDYVHDLRRERMKKHRSRRVSAGSSSGDVPFLDSDGRMKDAGSTSVSVHRLSPIKSPAVRRRFDSTDSSRSPMVDAVPLSSFLLAVSIVDKSVFGVTQLGNMTLPGKQLTSSPLKVLEHRCALFSPAAAGRHPRELTLETIFVPPGEDAAHAEEKLSAIGKRRLLERELDTSKTSSRTSSAALDASPVLNPQRSSLDHVGERDVKILSAGLTDMSDAGTARGDVGETDEELPGSGDEGKAPSPLRSIPRVGVQIPEKVAISMRAAGVSVVIYLGREAGLSQHDVASVVTLMESSAREIEVFVDIDTDKVALTLEASTLRVLDKSLLQAAAALRPTTIASPARGQSGQDDTRTQLFMVGPISIEASSTRQVCLPEYADSSLSGDDSESGAARQAPAIPTAPKPPAIPTPSTQGTEYPGFRRGRAAAAERIRRDRRFLDMFGSWRMRDWRVRLNIGAYTVELGTRDDSSCLDEVWRDFRFSMPKLPLRDTQVLRGITADSSGTAKRSTWVVKTGARDLTVGVKMPVHEHGEVSLASPPISYVYVSSSESETYTPPSTPSASSSPALSMRGNASLRTSSRLSEEAKVCFPSEDKSTESGSSRRQQRSPTSRAAREAVGIGNAPGAGTAENSDFEGTPNNEELLRRINELEGELEALKTTTATAASSASAAAAAVTAAAVGSSTSEDAPQNLRL